MKYTTNRQNYTATQRVLILNYDYTLTDTLKKGSRQSDSFAKMKIRENVRRTNYV